jgi:Non-ribosomal peptide synthetase modules and related proteins
MQKNVIEYLLHTAEVYPQKVAVQDSTKEITFAHLVEHAHILASKIRQFGIKKSPIGVYMQKGCDAVTAFAALSMSGNFYVPLDTKSPRIRIESIITVLDTPMLVTDREHFTELQSITDRKIFVIDDLYSSFQLMAIEDLMAEQIDTDPVYSIFTSGSTGTPKGVVVSHRGVIDYIDWAVDTFHINSTSVIGNQAPFYFDNSTLDIYLMYATGATLNIIPEACFAFPAKLVQYLDEKQISFVFWVPFVLVNMANFKIFDNLRPKYLRDVFFAGEVMPNKHLNYWRHNLPACRYVNLYGPTEITVDCTYYIVEREFRDDELLPIGFPCKNSNVLILNADMRLCAVNEQGELCVRGSSLALGYFNNPEKTAEAFIQNPLNKNYPETIYCTGDIVYKNELGEIIYIGRKDSQIKHNGYRIELGEIETAALASQMIENCCVVYDFLRKKIVIIYQAKENLNIVEFRKAILANVPKYMLPSEYHRVEIMKQNASGKIDRKYYNDFIKNGQN